MLAASDLSGKILVDSSTIDTGTSLEVGEETKKRHPKAFFYDGPVSGGVSGAGAGTLTIMMGCPSTDPRLPLLTAVFLMMAGNVIACGAPSLGLVAKLCNNYLSLTIS